MGEIYELLWSSFGLYALFISKKCNKVKVEKVKVILLQVLFSLNKINKYGKEMFFLIKIVGEYNYSKRIVTYY